MISEYCIPQESREETELERFYSERGKEFTDLLDNAAYMAAKDRWQESTSALQRARSTLLDLQSTIPQRIYEAAEQHLIQTEKRTKSIGVLISS